MAPFTRRYDLELEIPFRDSGTSRCKSVSLTPRPSKSRFGQLLAVVCKCLSLLIKPPASFEIRNIRTGVEIGPFPDGTLAYRAARELGKDWYVFRLEQLEADELMGSMTSARARTDPPVLAKNDPGSL